ncbi:hypothetical protein TeGR_g2156, partial [Tetraparma gracilis]
MPPRDAASRDAASLYFSYSDPSGVLSPPLVSASMPSYPGVVARLPPGKGFGFLQFPSAQDAQRCLAENAGGLDVLGVELALKRAGGKGGEAGGGRGGGEGGGR